MTALSAVSGGHAAPLTIKIDPAQIGDNLAAAQTPTDATNQLIGRAEVAKMLGVYRVTVANWLRQGRIPAFQYGERGVYRLRREDVRSYIEQSRLPHPRI